MRLGEAEDAVRNQAAAEAVAADANALAPIIARELSRAFTYTAPTPVPVADPKARLVQQFGVLNKLIKRDFAPEADRNDFLMGKLADFLLSKGVQNVLDIGFFDDPKIPLSFWYDKRTGAVIGINAYGGIPPQKNDILTYIAHDDTRTMFTVYLKFTPDGYPVFLSYGSYNSGGWVDIRTGLIFLASVAITAGAAAYISAIGTAVLGAEMAAAYPALAQAIGNAVVSTALNGGDVKAGVTSAIAGGAGGAVAGQVASVTTSEIIGQVAGAVTRSFITGGDMKMAALQALLKTGATSMQSVLLAGNNAPALGFFGTDDTADLAYDFGAGAVPDMGYDYDFSTNTGGGSMGDYFTDDYGIIYGTDADGNLAVVDFVDEHGIGYVIDANGDYQVADTPGYDDLTQTYPVFTPGPSTVPGRGGDGTLPISQNPGAGSVLSTLATTALSLVNSYIKAGAPPIRTGTSTGAVQKNGMVATKQPNGAVTTSKPAVGTPYAAADGSLITNNGNGTYTTISPAGVVSTKPYPGGASGSVFGSIPPLYIAGGAGLLALVFLLRK